MLNNTKPKCTPTNRYWRVVKGAIIQAMLNPIKNVWHCIAARGLLRCSYNSVSRCRQWFAIVRWSTGDREKERLPVTSPTQRVRRVLREAGDSSFIIILTSFVDDEILGCGSALEKMRKSRRCRCSFSLYRLPELGSCTIFLIV